MVDVTNESHDNPAEHHNVVTLDDVTGDAMTCTCPHHVHCNAVCKHMAAVENAIDEGTLETFLSNDDETDEDDVETTECDCDGLGGSLARHCITRPRPTSQAFEPTVRVFSARVGPTGD
ncbi:SWIM zinc finger family protein [Haladaptatus halobius]|uniref:SWIM zinc finger family protein n=1 Tax=Haladaptatus halobius TaxID=2884875 RepID=UPI001D09CBBE|nr:SWIM zinc finger family protein [Haladaptatus halobius]